MEARVVVASAVALAAVVKVEAATEVGDLVEEREGVEMAVAARLE